MNFFWVIENIIALLERLHRAGIGHGDAHLNNIMVKTEYPEQMITGDNILDFYKSFEYEYYFIDMGKSFDLQNTDQEYRDFVEVLDHLYELAEDDPSFTDSIEVLKTYIKNLINLYTYK